MNDIFVGWDIGGAHLKFAAIDDNGAFIQARQLPSPLWKGLDTLDDSLAQALREPVIATGKHAITMTGELADIFPDRATGVRALVDRYVDQVDQTRVAVFAGEQGFVDVASVNEYVREIASANWYASALFIAHSVSDAILVDIGSTTTDIVLVEGGKPLFRGYTDAERLVSGELLYTGVVRTPVMAVVTDRVPFNGDWQPIAAELFATMADVYLLSGGLSDYPEWAETADGAGRSPKASARRLARMLGRDLGDEGLTAWRRLARFISGVHKNTIRHAVECAVSRGNHHDDPIPLVGAGVGRFLVRRVATELECPYVDFTDLVRGPALVKSVAGDCAPAVALAYLLRSS